MTIDYQTKEIKECFSCKLIGSSSLVGISAYIFYNAKQHTLLKNKLILNLLGTGEH
jgi:hypothetical protein